MELRAKSPEDIIPEDVKGIVEHRKAEEKQGHQDYVNNLMLEIHTCCELHRARHLSHKYTEFSAKQASNNKIHTRFNSYFHTSSITNKFAEKTEDMQTGKYIHTICPEWLDANGKATVPSLYRLMVNSIGTEIRESGYGIDVMAKDNLTWALARCAMEIRERPALYEEVSVEIWPGKASALCHDRCARMLGQDGRVLCSAVTEWCVLDKDTRRPVEKTFIGGESDREYPCPGPSRIKPFITDSSTGKVVCYSDCDFNGHLNNSRYIDIFYDLIPLEAATSTGRLEVNFKREIRIGSLTESGVSRTEDGYEFCMYGDGQLACCARLLQ